MKKDKNKIFWESLSFEYHLATLLTVFQSTRAVVLKPAVATHMCVAKNLQCVAKKFLLKAA